MSNDNNMNANAYDNEKKFDYALHYMRQQPMSPLGPPATTPFSPPFRPPFGFIPGQQRLPIGPPPAFIPQRQPSIFAVDPGAIRPCQFRFIYIWLKSGRQFWAYLVFVGPRSVAGFRWTGFRWMYFGTDLRNIDSFICY